MPVSNCAGRGGSRRARSPLDWEKARERRTCSPVALKVVSALGSASKCNRARLCKAAGCLKRAETNHAGAGC